MSKNKETGTIIEIMDTRVVSDKFRVREFVVEVEDGKYRQLLLFQVTNDKCETLDKYGAGQTIEVEFNLRGRKWEGPNGVRYFNGLDVWRIKDVGGATHAPPQTDVAQDDVPF